MRGDCFSNLTQSFMMNKPIWLGMHNKRRKKLTLVRDESGVTAVVCALVFFVLCGFVGLALDIGHIVMVKNELQRTADAAALAGAMGFLPYNDPGPNQTPNWVQGVNNAHAIISNAANQAGNQQFSIRDGTVLYGYWLLRPPADYVQPPLAAVPNANSAYLSEPAIYVTLSRNVPLYFAPLIGVSSPKTVIATATAILPEANQTSGLPPIAVDWNTAFNNNGGTYTINVTPDQTIKPQSNVGVAGWFNQDGSNDVPSVRIETTITAGVSNGTQIYLAPGTMATLMNYVSAGQTVTLPVVDDVTQKVWKPVKTFVSFKVDSVSSNSMTGEFVTVGFDPNVTPSAGDAPIYDVAGTPKLVSP
jgi:hypothetical protein